MDAKLVDENTSLKDALNSLDDLPILLVRNPHQDDTLLGIVTAFDLL